MNSMQSVSFHPYNKISFKSENKSQTQPKVLIEQTTDELDLQNLMNEQQKKIKKEEKRRNISLATNIALATAFVGMLGVSIYQQIKEHKPAKKTLFTSISDKLPSLDSGCINPKVKSFIKNAVALLKKPKELAEYYGGKDSGASRMVLFWGPTGTGKTFSAKLLAKELGAEYGEVQFSDLSSEYIGKTAVNITKKFEELKKIAKKNPDKQYVVTFNEIDSLINNVENLSGESTHLGQNRTSFLNGLDYIKDCPNLTIVGTTNINPNGCKLDSATLSRLGQIKEIELPIVEEIISSLKFHLQKSPAAGDLIKNEADLRTIAEKIYEKQGAQRDVENIVRETFHKQIATATDKNYKYKADDLLTVINEKETWAAAQKKDIPQTDIMPEPQFLNFLLKLFDHNQKA